MIISDFTVLTEPLKEEEDLEIELQPNDLKKKRTFKGTSGPIIATLRQYDNIIFKPVPFLYFSLFLQKTWRNLSSQNV